MKNKKLPKKKTFVRRKDELDDRIRRPKIKEEKIKYRNMKHFLEDEDVDLPGLFEEE